LLFDVKDKAVGVPNATSLGGNLAAKMHHLLKVLLPSSSEEKDPGISG